MAFGRRSQEDREAAFADAMRIMQEAVIERRHVNAQVVTAEGALDTLRTVLDELRGALAENMHDMTGDAYSDLDALALEASRLAYKAHRAAQEAE